MNSPDQQRASVVTPTLCDISVIICAYTDRRFDDLIAAVDSVQGQTVPPAQIIVVVDHNPSLFRRVRVALPSVVTVENEAQRGLSGARNTGIAMATGNIVAFLDDDALAAPNWLARLSSPYGDSQVIGVGGAILPLWPTGGPPTWFPEEFTWVVGCTYRGLPRRAARVRNLIGCNMSFRREVFPAVGTFQDGIGRVGTRPVGCEETELCIRIGKHWPDRTLLYEPAARVQHRVSPERTALSYFRARCYSEGLSKAQVAREAGNRDALSSELSYTTRVLPLGVLRGLIEAVTLRDPLGGCGRAGAILGGLAMTTVGYAYGTLALRVAQRPGMDLSKPGASMVRLPFPWKRASGVRLPTSQKRRQSTADD